MIKIADLRQLAAGQFDAVEVTGVAAIRADDEPAVVVPPAGVGEVQMMRMTEVIGQLADADAGDAVGVCG
jgi:hypothetical protein